MSKASSSNTKGFLKFSNFHISTCGNLLVDDCQFGYIRKLLKQGACHTVALPFTLKKYFKAKEMYVNSNISPCKNIIFQKNPLKETKILQDIITSITDLKLQHKPKYRLPKILV